MRLAPFLPAMLPHPATRSALAPRPIGSFLQSTHLLKISGVDATLPLAPAGVSSFFRPLLCPLMFAWAVRRGLFLFVIDHNSFSHAQPSELLFGVSEQHASVPVLLSRVETGR